MSTAGHSVLIVDDEAVVAELFSLMVEELGMSVCGTAATAHEAVRIAEHERPDLVLMDVRLKGEGDGVDAGLAIHRSVGCPIIYITGSREPETLARINSDHPAALMIKPVSEPQFRSTIRRMLAASGSTQPGPDGGGA